MAKILTGADILNSPDNLVKRDLESVGGCVYVKKYSPADREKIADFYNKAREDADGKYRIYDFQALVMELVIVDADAKPIFTADQLAELKTRSEQKWDELWGFVEEVNPAGTKADVKKAKENLSQPQADSSASN